MIHGKKRNKDLFKRLTENWGYVKPEEEIPLDEQLAEEEEEEELEEGGAADRPESKGKGVDSPDRGKRVREAVAEVPVEASEEEEEVVEGVYNRDEDEGEEELEEGWEMPKSATGSSSSSKAGNVSRSDVANKVPKGFVNEDEELETEGSEEETEELEEAIRRVVQKVLNELGVK